MGWAHAQGSVRQGGCGPEPTAQIAGAPARCPARRERALAALHPHTGRPSPTATHGGSWHPDSGGLLARVLYFRFVSSCAAEVHGGSILGVRMEGASFQSGRVCLCWSQASYRTTVASILSFYVSVTPDPRRVRSATNSHRGQCFFFIPYTSQGSLLFPLLLWILGAGSGEAFFCSEDRALRGAGTGGLTSNSRLSGSQSTHILRPLAFRHPLPFLAPEFSRTFPRKLSMHLKRSLLYIVQHFWWGHGMGRVLCDPAYCQERTAAGGF